MKLVELGEVLGLGEYEAIRERFRARIIDEKRQRRVKLGDRASCVFENHDTALFQVQEMLRTERITKRSAVQHEIDTYNELVPGDHELSVTVMIEIDDKAVRDDFLARAVGMENHVYLDVDGERVKATWDPERAHTDHLSAVMYLKLPLGPALATRVKSGKAAVTLGVDHPAYTASLRLPDHVVLSVADDLE